MDENEDHDHILYSSFNQDASCFVTGTEKGFRIYNSFPLKSNYERDLGGGIGIVEMLYRCNILALVGGGKKPKFNKNFVIFWDDKQEKIVSELRFESKILNLKLKKDKIIVVLEQNIFIFNFNNFNILDKFDTASNPHGKNIPIS